MSEHDLRALLETLEPAARDTLRRILIHDQAARDAVASQLQLLRYRNENGQRWGDVIDFLTMYPDARRQVVRVVAEIDAGDSGSAEL